MRGIGPGASVGKQAAEDDDETAEVVSLRNDRACSVLLIERRTLIRDCLSRCISADFGAPVISFASIESLQAASAELHPALIIVGDLERVEMNTDGVIDRLRRAEYKAPIIVLSDAEDIDNVTDTLRSGASGHVPTGIALDVAIEAMRLVLVGGVFVPGDTLLSVSKQSRTAEARAARNIIFTARQSAVLDALCQGKTNKLIAYELNMSESTVKVHVSNIMKKLQAKNRTEVAVRLGDHPSRNQHVA